MREALAWVKGVIQSIAGSIIVLALLPLATVLSGVLAQLPTAVIFVTALGAAAFGVWLAVGIRKLFPGETSATEVIPYGGFGPEGTLAVHNVGGPARFMARGRIVGEVRQRLNPYRKQPYTIPWAEWNDARLEIAPGGSGTLILGVSEAVIGWDLYQLNICEVRPEGKAVFDSWRWNASDGENEWPEVLVEVTIVAEPRLRDPFRQVFRVVPAHKTGGVTVEQAGEGARVKDGDL